MSQADSGRICPLHYRYGAAALAQAPLQAAHCVYVVGGLYGNVEALNTLEAMARSESAQLCFNGDFNWFNCDDASFAEVNQRVLAHQGTLGNVEAELGAASDDAGCGCAYPDSVDAGVVQRSNQIHAVLKQTAARHPAVLAQLATWPMYRRYQVGGCRVGVVHGDADALAGWRFDVATLGLPSEAAWQERAFAQAQVDVFASSHTCLPALRRLHWASGGQGVVANNGAAGMPNFADELYGLCVRIGVEPTHHPCLHELSRAGAYISLLPLRYDNAAWQRRFVANWPPGSPAWESYYPRICHGPQFSPASI